MLPEVQQPAVSQENASSYIPPPNLHHQLDQPPQQQQTFNSNYFFQNYANIATPVQHVPENGIYRMQDFAPPPPPYYNITNMGDGNVPQTQQSVIQESDFNVLKTENNSPSPVRASIEKVNNNKLASILKWKVCAICGDRPTGKHYGAYACDGCKGFFRRNIRSNTRNQCRFNQDCVVGMSNRNQCRACRMRKCFEVGMRRESVQKERDPISQQNRQKQIMTQDGKSSTSILVALLKAEISSREIENHPADFRVNIESKRIANLKDISISLEQHSPALVKWAGLIPTMSQLSRNDQFILFKANLIEKWILDLVIRSLPLNNILLLSNDLIIPKNCDTSTESPQITRIYSRIFNEIVATMKELSLDNNEIACLKAITFFNPSVAGLDSQNKVKQLRSQMHECLEDYINQKGRFGEILLILPALQSIITELLVQMRALPKLELPNPQLQPEMVQIKNENSKVEENINESTSS